MEDVRDVHLHRGQVVFDSLWAPSNLLGAIHKSLQQLPAPVIAELLQFVTQAAQSLLADGVLRHVCRL